MNRTDTRQTSFTTARKRTPTSSLSERAARAMCPNRFKDVLAKNKDRNVITLQDSLSGVAAGGSLKALEAQDRPARLDEADPSVSNRGTGHEH